MHTVPRYVELKAVTTAAGSWLAAGRGGGSSINNLLVLDVVQELW
jgi:hypothetical protein